MSSQVHNQRRHYELRQQQKLWQDRVQSPQANQVEQQRHPNQTQTSQDFQNQDSTRVENSSHNQGTNREFEQHLLSQDSKFRNMEAGGSNELRFQVVEDAKSPVQPGDSSSSIGLARNEYQAQVQTQIAEQDAVIVDEVAPSQNLNQDNLSQMSQDQPSMTAFRWQSPVQEAQASNEAHNFIRSMVQGQEVRLYA